ncbi:MAG: proteinral secretion pathway protein G [Parcubacteria group bacterium Gr01-1014_73]|nr:MAG: proteinral secretion pathway protein G [Parcubacteria group bacterium Gr01-1014_73]
MKKGFTLIELLVVIAIIAILTSIVTANLGSARQKARDIKRVSDVKQLQLALAFYADANSNRYPTTLAPLASIYIQAIPVPPGGTSQTAYSYAALGSGASCTSYHLGALLEVTGSAVLLDDSDASAGTICTNSAADFSGTDPVFDVKP